MRLLPRRLDYRNAIAAKGDAPRAPDVLKMRIAIGILCGIVFTAIMLVGIRFAVHFLIGIIGTFAAGLLAYASFLSAWESYRTLRTPRHRR